MKNFHLITERIMLGLFALCFSFVCVFVPNGWNTVPKVEAGAAAGGATLFQQLVDTVIHKSTNVLTSISASADTITAVQTTGSFLIDNVLDGIAWSLAKSIVSKMTSSIINWVNSGFNGSPAFLTDMKGFISDIADKEVGNYLEELGGPFSFVCSPFRLDVSIALAVSYEQSRTYGETSSCTLTGALANIDKFIDGTESFVDGGGWDSWFTMTSNPEQYTPVGNMLAAKAELNARITNAKGEELTFLDFGSGFLSSKVCEKIEGRENCQVATPGKVINEALTFQTSAGARSLIAADEINEIISAVFAQIGQQAITGAAGLLGLSPNTGYTSERVPFTTQVSEASAGSDPDQMLALVLNNLAIEQEYLALAEDYLPLLRAYANDGSKETARRNDARAAADAIPALIVEIKINIIALDNLVTEFNKITPTMSSAQKQDLMQKITTDYFALRYLHSEVEIDGKANFWGSLLR